MDSLLELNNDLRFEHFIDESLDIDMSAVAMLPSLHSEPYFNFVDDILTTSAASRRLKSISPVLEFAANTTHEFLVRLSPEAKKKSPHKEEERATGEDAPQEAVAEHQEASTIVEQKPVVVTVEKIDPIGRKKKQTVAKEDASHEFLVPPVKKKAPTKSKSLPIEFTCNNCDERFASHLELDKHYR